MAAISPWSVYSFIESFLQFRKVVHTIACGIEGGQNDKHLFNPMWH